MMPTFAPADFRWATHRLSKATRRGRERPAGPLGRPGLRADQRGRRAGLLQPARRHHRIWPPTSPQPVRIEFWGDEIESLRLLPPRYPALEHAARQHSSCRRPASCRSGAARTPCPTHTLDSSTTCARSAGGMGSATGSSMDAGRVLRGPRTVHRPTSPTRAASLLDYCGPGDLIVVDEPETVRLADRRTGAQRRGTLHRVRQHRRTPRRSARPYIAWDALTPRLISLAPGNRRAGHRGSGRRPPVPHPQRPTPTAARVRAAQALHRQHRRGDQTMWARCWPTGSAWSSSASRPSACANCSRRPTSTPPAVSCLPGVGAGGRGLDAHQRARGGRRRGTPANLPAQTAKHRSRPTSKIQDPNSKIRRAAARPARGRGAAPVPGRRWTRAGAASRCS